MTEREARAKSPDELTSADFFMNRLIDLANLVSELDNEDASSSEKLARSMEAVPLLLSAQLATMLRVAQLLDQREQKAEHLEALKQILASPKIS